MINLIISCLFIFVIGFIIKSIMSKPTSTNSADETHTQNETSSKQEKSRNLPTEFISVFIVEGKSNFHGIFLINGKEVDMIISTGTRINVINERIWKKLGKPKLNNMDCRLENMGTSVQSHGFFNADIKDPETGLSTKAKFYVIITPMDLNIIGAETLQALASSAGVNPFEYVHPRMQKWGAEQNDESWD
uniref:Uncharacterized protein n=1 Tax=Panagrolaimus sp. JU765 TaxID=591449 RepID=A0AC34RPL6_9BILA